MPAAMPPMVLLTAPSLASMMRGSPVQKLTAMLTTFTITIRVARPLKVRSLTSPTMARTAGTTLLSASEGTSSTPSLRSR